MARTAGESTDYAEPLRMPGGVVTQIAKTWAVLHITLASRLAYVAEILIRTLFLVLVLYIFTQLWQTTNRSHDVIGLTGFTIPQLIWYLVFSEAITMSASRGNQEVDTEVKSGDIAYRLARPLPYPLYHLGASLGERLLRFGLNLLVGSMVAAVIVGPIRLGAAPVAAALAAALGSFLVDFVISFAISLLAFWVEDTAGMHFLYSRMLMILGGLLIPLDAYPSWLASVARALPFQYLVYQPARLFVSADARGWSSVLAIQALLLVVSLAPMLLLYRAGLRRVSTQGG